MMGNGMVGFVPWGLAFVLLYAGVVLYFLIQLTGINKALQRIAGVLEKTGHSK